ncbi:LutC/YkgG family protein [Mucilaginibacter segetis]|uniref:LUD domain-containing protein n=1 Tax=Mucilaginibacter segetis TaxID=2793071 RepID=A0A934PSQ4_9SPHI|nr:LUD domain-containing protein [Mucilaginibacter segetis]MBK0378720.1 LUD domain-containing protein [Mucilaginibacter segetis]
MTERDKILAAIRANQPVLSPLPEIKFNKVDDDSITDKFIKTLTTIGGKVVCASKNDDIFTYISSVTITDQRILNMTDLADLKSLQSDTALPHSLQNVELAVIKGHFGVAENGAIWVTEELIGERVLPFISQNLVVVLNVNDLVDNMHEAYEKIDHAGYSFGTFIAGPSKTADIEQSLVVGAHGARSMTVFLIE